jgi:hypothetical protein
MVSTFAGSGETGFENGPDSLATFDFPRGCVMDYQGHRLYVVDYNNHAVRIIHVSEITGMTIDEIEDGFSVFPNPAKDEIHIVGMFQQSNFVIRIYNASGQLVQAQSGINGTTTFHDISELENGVYSIILFNGNAFMGIKKLIVMRD